MKIWIPSFLLWRYEVRYAKHIDLYGSLGCYLKEKLTQYKYRYFVGPNVVYIYANKRNVGDYISHLGVKTIVNIDGPSSFCSPAYLKQLEKYRSRNPDVMLVIGGGGLFLDAFTEFWNLVLATKLKYCVVGVGITKMYGRKEMPPHTLKNVIASASYALVRDSESINRLGSYAQSGSVMMSVCPYLNCFSRAFWNKASHNNRLLLHMVHPSDLRLAETQLDIITRNLKAIATKLGLTYAEHSNMSANHKKCLHGVRNARIAVSIRLHRCIMSYGMGILFLPLYCDYKMESFVMTPAKVNGIEAKLAERLDVLSASIDATLESFNPSQTDVSAKITLKTEFGKELSLLAKQGL
jgi:hypothetical protein